MSSIRTILVVDDEASFRDFAAETLAAAGFLTRVAGDGREAIRSLEQLPFDLAVVDLVMPEKEGVETIMEIKRRWPGCKVVAICEDGRFPASAYLRLATGVGADATLAKPFSAIAVLDAVRELLSENVKLH